MGLQFICTPSLHMQFAEVVKLANTLRSGRSERKLLRVQLPPSAPGRYGETAYRPASPAKRGKRYGE